MEVWILFLPPRVDVRRNKFRDSKYYFEIFVQIPYSTSEITTGVILND
jgi:hypothetical protein